MVASGDFSSDTGWTLPTGWSVSGGQLLYDGTGVLYSKARFTLSGLIPGQLYKLVIDIAALSASTVNFGFGDTAGAFESPQQTYSDAGTHTRYMVASGNTATLVIQNNEAGMTLLIASVSVAPAVEDRSVSGNHFDIHGTITRAPVAMGADLVWHTFDTDCTVDLGEDITSSGSLVWWEQIDGLPVRHVRNFDGSGDYVNGASGAPPTTGVSITGNVLTFHAGATLALVRPSSTPIPAAQVAREHAEERAMIDAACTLYGTSDAVTAMAHDKVTGVLHVGTSDGRSVLSGLRRVSNTTTPIAEAIAAHGGMIVEG